MPRILRITLHQKQGELQTVPIKPPSDRTRAAFRHPELAEGPSPEFWILTSGFSPKCETNPICHPNNQKMRNEPNSSIPIVSRRPLFMQNEPNLPSRQLPHPAITRNEPNFRRDAQPSTQKTRNEPNLHHHHRTAGILPVFPPPDYAKRTQFTRTAAIYNPSPIPRATKTRQLRSRKGLAAKATATGMLGFIPPESLISICNISDAVMPYRPCRTKTRFCVRYDKKEVK